MNDAILSALITAMTVALNAKMQYLRGDISEIDRAVTLAEVSGLTDAIEALRKESSS